MPDEREEIDRRTAVGVTLLGVLLSVGVSVGLGVTGPWWFRALVGMAVVVVLILAAKAATRRGTGRIARFARWIITSDDSAG